jgi:hypothetical protein
MVSFVFTVIVSPQLSCGSRARPDAEPTAADSASATINESPSLRMMRSVRVESLTRRHSRRRAQSGRVPSLAQLVGLPLRLRAIAAASAHAPAQGRRRARAAGNGVRTPVEASPLEFSRQFSSVGIPEGYQRAPDTRSKRVATPVVCGSRRNPWFLPSVKGDAGSVGCCACRGLVDRVPAELVELG